MKEIIALRTENSKTYDLGGGRRRVVVDPTFEPPAKDTYLRDDSPDSNYGTGGAMWLRDWASYIERLILEFDISGLPAGQILTSAKLQLYYWTYNAVDPVGKTAWVYKLTPTDWVEAQATWNIYKTGSIWTTPGGDYVTSNPSGGSTIFPASSDWMYWDVLAIVQDAYGNAIPAEFLVKFADETYTEETCSEPAFRTKEYTTSLQPKLVIEYTAAVSAPTVIAKPATSVEVTTARLNGEVTDNGGENPTVHIYWGTSDGETTPGNWDHDENLGALGVVTFHKDISGLTRGTKYYYRCYAQNSGGSTWSSSAEEFTTLLEKPVAASNAATGVGVSAATLNGTVTDDGGEDCQYRFRYKKAGGDYVYINWVGAKATGEPFSEGISGLDASSTYYFNARVKNSQFESDWGAELTFNTGAVIVAPTGTTDPATLVADIEATLNGTVTGDGGEACEVRFQYYTGVGDWTDNETVWQPRKLTNDTFSQRISGLTPNTEYHFRAQIKNSDSTASGADRTFTTKIFPTPFLRRVLRDVFGGGADISADNPLQVYDPVTTSIGKLQVAVTTIDLNQAAASYDLFIGTDQDVVVEKLIFRMPDVDISGGTLTSISIQTDDTTAQVFISATDGALANLTQEAQLAWTGAVLVKVGTKIQLTIATGASDVECVCDVIAECRAVVTGGYLG